MGRAVTGGETVAESSIGAPVPRAVEVAETELADGTGGLASASFDDEHLIGTSVGRYRVIERVGAGGMGVVYRALDPALDRTVALKVLPPLEPVRRTHLEERLHREAQALARLDHENVVAVYDVGLAEASLFVAMQFIDGPTLDEYLRAHPTKPRGIVALFAAAGRGLAAAHAAQIIHRDVKPSNILVDRAGRVYVGDFGLARGTADAERAPGSSDDRLASDMTRHGAVVGTPRFMAPEQHRGEPATALSDQYSFCVALWCELFAKHPFAAGAWDPDTALAAMEADRMVEPPGARDVPARVMRALRRGLRHAPAERWPDMGALLAELEPRSRTRWVIGGLTAAGLAGGFAAALAFGGLTGGGDPCAHAADEMAAAYSPARRAAIATKFAKSGLPYAAAIAARVQGRLDSYTNAWAVQRREVCEAHSSQHDSDERFDRRVACLDLRVVAVRSTLGVLTDQPTADVVDRAPDLVGALPPVADCANTGGLATEPQPADPKIRLRIAELEAQLARVTTVGTVATDARAIAADVVAAEQLVVDARAIGWRPLVGRALANAAAAQERAARSDLAIERYRDAATELARAQDDLGAANAAIHQAYLLAQQDDGASAIKVLDNADLFLIRAGNPPAARARAEQARGVAYGELSKLPESEAAYQRALAILDKQTPRDDIQYARVLLDEASTLGHSSQYDRAHALLEQVAKIYETQLSPDHPYVAQLHSRLSNLAFQTGKIDEGKAELEKARAIIVKRYPEDHISRAQLLLFDAQLALRQHKPADAEKLYLDAVVRMKRLDPQGMQTTTAIYMLGVSQLQQNHLDAALASFQEVLAQRLATLGDSHPKVADVLDAISNVYQMRNDDPRAVETSRRALAIREKVLGPDNPDLVLTLSSLAYLAIEANDCATATEEGQRGIAILERAHSPAYLGVDPRIAVAACDLRANRLDAAQAAFDALLPLVDSSEGTSPSARANVRKYLADVWWKRGDHKRALDYAAQARKVYLDANDTEDAAELAKYRGPKP